MSDGTTINFQAMEITESEMSTAWHAFDRMRNAVIEGSKLATQFQALQVQVEQLRQQVETQIESNKRLDDMYLQARRQRDEAWQETAGLRAELEKVQQESQVQVGNLQHDLQAANQQVQLNSEEAKKQAERDNVIIFELHEQIDTLKKERDSALEEAVQWEEKAHRFRRSLEAVREKLAGATTALGLEDPEAPPSTPPVDDSPAEAEPEQPVTPQVYGTYGATQPRDPATQQWRPWDDKEKVAG